MQQTILHKADTRHSADHGWLISEQTFSFHGHYDPERLQFGALRVLNDDVVSGGKGFGEHPHDNMEITSIPLDGILEHQDSMGNLALIRPGEIQVMSAGTGIYHTEYNKNADEPVSFLQIWLYPNKLNVAPRYDQQDFSKKDKHNKWLQVLSPDAADDGVWIYQNAWFYLGDFDKGFQVEYQLKDESNGVYVFVIEGDVKIGEQVLGKRDGFGIWNAAEVHVSALNDIKLLVMEVPRKW